MWKSENHIDIKIFPLYLSEYIECFVDFTDVGATDGMEYSRRETLHPEGDTIYSDFPESE